MLPLAGATVAATRSGVPSPYSPAAPQLSSTVVRCAVAIGALTGPGTLRRTQFVAATYGCSVVCT